MNRSTATSRELRAGCFVCHDGIAHWTGANAQALAARHHDRTGHGTWCEVQLSITYGSESDDRQTDIEDAIAAVSSGGRSGSPPLANPDALAVAPAGVSAPEGRPVETRRQMPRGARGRKSEIHAP